MQPTSNSLEIRLMTLDEYDAPVPIYRMHTWMVGTHGDEFCHRCGFWRKPERESQECVLASEEMPASIPEAFLTQA